MKEYLRERNAREHNAKLTGAILTLALHVCAAAFLSFSGVKYLYPPPQEQTFLLDFEDEDESVVQQRHGNQPLSEETDPTKPLELVQKSKSSVVSRAENLTPATKPDDFGDVPVPPAEAEAKLDPRASFPGMAKKDTTLTSPHSATEASADSKAGHPTGNTTSGATTGKPNARLQGRSVVGNIPKPGYGIQESGTVVVSVWVDQYGSVKKAISGAEGTTVTDKALWAAARKAAMETHFNMKADAPVMQEGTITYIFNLK